MVGCERGSAGAVVVDQISKLFGMVTAVEPTSFSVSEGALVTLLGPSGSGKTTILKIIAGFEEPSTGKVLISGADVTNIPAHKRNLGFVFQQYALFPHLTVAENIAYPLRMRRIAGPEIRRRVAEALNLIQLEGLGDRRPAQLSGGQQQRVALARAIVFRPPLLLMDEPMSALDKRLREEMQFEIRRLQKQLGITTIAVTHDQTEAVVMSDTIIVLNEGRVEQIGAPGEVYRRPRSEFVANFLGESNIFRGSVEQVGDDFVLACGPTVQIPLARDQRPADAGRVIYVIRPECISLGSSCGDDAITMAGRVADTIFSGEAVRIAVDVGLGTAVVAKVLSRGAAWIPRAGAEVTINWRAADATVVR
jgi:putative spermidine/putrescine transport system ATP-binding protein